MPLATKVQISLQNFSGDANGNLFGNYGVFGVTTTNGVDKVNATPFGNINIQAIVVAGQNPIDTLNAALAANNNLGTTTVVVTPPVTPTP